MKEIKISRPIEIVAGSGLALNATVAVLKNPQLTTELDTTTDSEDHTATITTVLGTAVV